jgi:hypothetical protein
MKVYHTKEIRATRKLPMMQAINHLQQKQQPTEHLGTLIFVAC